VNGYEFDDEDGSFETCGVIKGGLDIEFSETGALEAFLSTYFSDLKI